MAEFKIVMHEMARMCDDFAKKNACKECLIHHNPVCNALRVMDGEDIAQAEAAIMQWAAEHPEPTYPTWGVWLKKLYNDTYPPKILITPIPADIAEKLGIEPKEEEQ